MTLKRDPLSAGFELDENSYVGAVWFGGAPGHDWLCMIYKAHTADAAWIMKYRHRYHGKGEFGDPFTDDDRKNWYSARVFDREKAEALIEGPIRLASLAMGINIERTEINGGVQALMAALGDKPWWHARRPS